MDSAAVPAAVAAPLKAPVSVSVPEERLSTEGNALRVELAEGVVRVGVSAAAKPAVDLQPSALHFAEGLQKAAVAALISAKSQETAADAMADAEWVVAEGEVRVQTEISKTMLSMVINAEAEKLIRNAVRDAGAGALKLVLLPGAKKAEGEKKVRAPKSGSAQAKALEHPIVQRAQTLFNAEIRTVIDLRDNE